jgi:HAD superfamily hydrolase (TIGR01662 family)
MFRNLAKGYDITHEGFFKAYKTAHDKYRKIRYKQLIEVTNAIWLSEALENLGHKTTPKDEKIRTAVNVFFKDYLGTLKPLSNARITLLKLSTKFKLGIVSNFTYAPVIHASLRKLKFNKFFNVVIVSEEAGWRKPSPKIFHKALEKLDVKANEAIFIGDTPLEDIQGAKSVGMKTIFVPSKFNNLQDMQKAPQQPDYIIENLTESLEILKRLKI